MLRGKREINIDIIKITQLPTNWVETSDNVNIANGKIITVMASISPHVAKLRRNGKMQADTLMRKIMLYVINDIGKARNQPSTFGIKMNRALFIIPHIKIRGKNGESKSFFFFPIKELIKSNSVAASIIYVLLEIAKVFI